MVRDVFRLAKENAPAIIFIDEVDAIATARYDAQTGADREVQRILMELLNQVSIILTGAVNVLCITTYCALPIKLDLISLSLNL
jgi:ATP-dependent 26S proteasome regulatory subunit